MDSSAVADTNGQFFRARSGGKSFEIAVRSGRVFVDGEDTPCDFERISPNCYSLLLGRASYTIVVAEAPDGALSVSLAGRTITVEIKDEIDLLAERFGTVDTQAAVARSVHAPMPGLVLRVHVGPGDRVDTGDPLVVLEAMKMENELSARRSCTVKAVHVRAGDAVPRNALLITFEDDPA